MKDSSIQELPFKEQELRDELLEHCQFTTIPADTQILDEGAYVKVIPIVLDGIVKVTRQEEEREIMLYYIQVYHH